MGVNLGMLERTIRVAIGIVLIAIGLFVVRGILGIVVALVGALLIFSGSIGFCHVKKFFGIGTSKRT
ncbi:MAG: DUF2892 domain-containing protein [Coriobacteriia bacterium]|nr:DUF2892 domain-containing protein [Coriobacteriia bacterium]